MRYLLLIYGNNEIWGAYSEEQFTELIAADAKFQQELRESGELLDVAGLTEPDNARVVRVRDGVPVVTDGPYLEAKEYLASFFMIDCATHERALEVAARYPTASKQGVELWPLMQPA